MVTQSWGLISNNLDITNYYIYYFIKIVKNIKTILNNIKKKLLKIYSQK